MTSYISHTTVDCANTYELSQGWKPVLGYVDIDGDPYRTMQRLRCGQRQRDHRQVVRIVLIDGENHPGIVLNEIEEDFRIVPLSMNVVHTAEDRHCLLSCRRNLRCFSRRETW